MTDMSIEPDEYRMVLRTFRCELVRSSEESFARLLTGNPAVRLEFADDGSYTDGRRIFVDPSMSDAYRYRKGLMEAESSIGAEPGTFLQDPMKVLHTITRALTIHESLHIIYTRFPFIPPHEERARSHNGRMVLSRIMNIIEDYYIEMAGCAIYDNMATYLRFMRTAIGFASDRDHDAHPMDGTPRIVTFLNQMIQRILYPMVPTEEPPGWMEPYLESTVELFNQGCTSHDPDTRYHCACTIFDAVSDLIPEKDISEEHMGRNLCDGTDPGTGSSNRFSSGHKDIPHGPEPPKPLDDLGEPTRSDRFEGMDSDDPSEIIERGYEESRELVSRHERLHTPHTTVIPSSDYPGPHCHDGIDVRETVLGIVPESIRRYDALRKKVGLETGALDRMLKASLFARDREDERRLLLGPTLDSRMLYDHKGRVWKRRVDVDAIPDISIMLLIDGSGSMSERRDSTIDACVCIHEVLSMNRITHAIAEHRAESPDEMEVIVLKDFDGHPLQKTNIMRHQCHGVNRDGLALLWAENRLGPQHRDSDKGLVILVSDGLPNHEHAGIPYNGESAYDDVHGIVHRMHRSGTDVIAMALDDKSGELSSNLRRMFDNVISCHDVSELPRRLVSLLAKVLGNMF